MTFEEMVEKLKEWKITPEEIQEKLDGVVLTTGETAVDYVMSLPEEDRNPATQAILNVLQKGWPLNDAEITSEGRAINRKRLGFV